MPSLANGHVCCVVDSNGEQVARVAAFVDEGLAAGERVVVVQGPEGNEVVLQALRDRGIDADGMAAEGRLLLLGADDVYLVDGVFDIDRRMEEHVAFIEQSVADGYTAVRLAADARVALAVFGDIDALVAYEERVEALCHAVPVSGACFYDRKAFGAVLAPLVAAHPRGAADSQLAGESRPGCVRVAGDVDLSNVDLFQAMLAAASDDRGDVVVDLQGLSFIDLVGATALVRFSRGLLPHQRVTVLSPPRLLFTMLDTIGAGSDLDLVGEAAA